MDEQLAIELLSTQFINKYDIERTVNRVVKYMENYKRLEMQTTSEICLITSKDFSQIYVDKSSSHSDGVYGQIDKLIDNERLYNEISYKLSIVNKKLTPEEKAYFSIIFRDMKSEYIASNIIGRSRNGLKPIRNSCALKVALAIGKEVLKGAPPFDDED